MCVSSQYWRKNILNTKPVLDRALLCECVCVQREREGRRIRGWAFVISLVEYMSGNLYFFRKLGDGRYLNNRRFGSLPIKRSCCQFCTWQQHLCPPPQRRCNFLRKAMKPRAIKIWLAGFCFISPPGLLNYSRSDQVGSCPPSQNSVASVLGREMERRRNQ